MIFILNTRHGGTSETIDSLSISWNSYPSMVLIEPSSLPDSDFTRCCDWTEVSLSSCVSSPFRKAVPDFEASYLSLALSRSWRMASLAAVILYRPQDYCIPDAVIRFSSYLLKETFSPLHLYRGRSKGFNNPKIDNFLKVCAIYPKSSFSFCL